MDGPMGQIPAVLVNIKEMGARRESTKLWCYVFWDIPICLCLSTGYPIPMNYRYFSAIFGLCLIFRHIYARVSSRFLQPLPIRGWWPSRWSTPGLCNTCVDAVVRGPKRPQISYEVWWHLLIEASTMVLLKQVFGRIWNCPYDGVWFMHSLVRKCTRDMLLKQSKCQNFLVGMSWSISPEGVGLWHFFLQPIIVALPASPSI